MNSHVSWAIHYLNTVAIQLYSIEKKKMCCQREKDGKSIKSQGSSPAISEEEGKKIIIIIKKESVPIKTDKKRNGNSALMIKPQTNGWQAVPFSLILLSI